MIEGVVRAAREAVIPLTVRGSAGQEREIEAVIDTGFTGFLTLRPSLVAELGLEFRSNILATLADGSETAFPLYDAVVLWDGHPREVQAGAANTAPLVGMAMLDGCDLSVEVVDGGQVAVRQRA